MNELNLAEANWHQTSWAGPPGYVFLPEPVAAAPARLHRVDQVPQPQESTASQAGPLLARWRGQKRTSSSTKSSRTAIVFLGIVFYFVSAELSGIPT
jgi:hypothetical protein